jgi:hypothetical protein
LDVQIIFLTVRRILTRQGLQVDPGAAMLDLDEERRRQSLGELQSSGNGRQ